MLPSHTLGKVHSGFTPNLYFLTLLQHLAPWHKPTSAMYGIGPGASKPREPVPSILGNQFWDTGPHIGAFLDQLIDTRIRVKERKAVWRHTVLEDWQVPLLEALVAAEAHIAQPCSFCSPSTGPEPTHCWLPLTTFASTSRNNQVCRRVRRVPRQSRLSGTQALLKAVTSQVLKRV